MTWKAQIILPGKVHLHRCLREVKCSCYLKNEDCVINSAPKDPKLLRNFRNMCNKVMARKAFKKFKALKVLELPINTDMLEEILIATKEDEEMINNKSKALEV